MVEIKLRREESLQPDVWLIPDLIWSPQDGWADLALTPDGKDLAHSNGLHSVVTIALFTDRRAEDYDALPSDGTDPKGWWGDAVQLEDDIQPLGSKLWLLKRSTLSRRTEQLCEQYVSEAITPLVTQGAIASFDVTATADIPNAKLTFALNLYGKRGQLVYQNKFTQLWEQISPRTG